MALQPLNKASRKTTRSHGSDSEAGEKETWHMFGRRRYQSVTAITSARTAESDVCRQVRATFLLLTARLKSRSLRLKKKTVFRSCSTSHVCTYVDRIIFVLFVCDRRGFLAVCIVTHPLSFVHLAESVISGRSFCALLPPFVGKRKRDRGTK